MTNRKNREFLAVWLTYHNAIDCQSRQGKSSDGDTRCEAPPQIMLGTHMIISSWLTILSTWAGANICRCACSLISPMLSQATHFPSFFFSSCRLNPLNDRRKSCFLTLLFLFRIYYLLKRFVWISASKRWAVIRHQPFNRNQDKTK